MKAIEFSTVVLGAFILVSFLLRGSPVSAAPQATDNNNVEKLTLEAALALRYQRLLKQKEFKRTKEEALKYIPKEVRPGKLIQEGNFTSVIMEYDGEPMPLYIFLIAMIPLVLAELCRLIWNLLRPKLKFQQEGGGEFPFTACYHLQESLREQSLKRPARNCTSWFVHQYILSIEDETLEWKDVIESLQLPQPVRKRKPWHTIRLIFRMKNALKKVLHKDVELLEKNKPVLAGNHVECQLRTAPSENSLHLEHQISQLELYYKTLNTLEKDYEVPPPPHPELFTVRELMEFMTRDEKLLVLRCFDKSQMNELMINCNIEEIHKKNAEFVQAHMEAAKSVYAHVEEMKSKASSKMEPAAPAGNGDEKEKSIQTLFDIKDRLAKDIVEANDKLLEDWENSAEQNEVKESIQILLDPVHIKRTYEDNEMETADMLDNIALNEEPEDLKVKPLTSEERVEHLMKKAEHDINDMEERIKVKKKLRKKGKGKVNKKNTKDKKKDEDKKEAETTEEKTPFKWQRKSDDKDEMPKIEGPKLKQPPPKQKLKSKHPHRKSKKKEKLDDVQEEGENEDNEIEPKETKRKRRSADETGDKGRDMKGHKAGAKGRRNTNEDDTKEKEHRGLSGDENDVKGKRHISGNEPGEKEKRRTSADKKPRKTSRDKEKRKPSGEDDNRKLWGGEPIEKEKRRISEEESGDNEKRKLSEEKNQREITDDPQEKKKRRVSDDDPQTKKKRRISGDEPGQKEKRRISGGEPEQKEKRRISGEEPEQKEKRRISGNEPGEKDTRKHSRKSEEKEHRKHSGNDQEEKERRKLSESEPQEKDKRKPSGEEPEAIEHTNAFGSDPRENEKRRISGDKPREKEKRRTSGDEPGVREHRKHSGNDPGESGKRRTSGDEPGITENRKLSGNDDEEKEDRKYSEGESGEKKHRRKSKKEDPDEHRRTSEGKHRRKKSGNESGDDEIPTTPENEANERERRRSSQKKSKEREQQRIAENEHIGKEKRKHSENNDEKKRKMSENNEIAIQTHHHHHHNKNLPNLMVDPYQKQENKHRHSHNENEEAAEHGKRKHDIHAVHDATVDEFLKRTQNKNLTKSAEMAIHRDLIFQESEQHPQVKIYSQGRRAKFDAIKHGKPIKLNDPVPDGSPQKGNGDNTKALTDEET